MDTGAKVTRSKAVARKEPETAATTVTRKEPETSATATSSIQITQKRTPGRSETVPATVGQLR
ncbi:hypothetical protein PGT21_009994 [Puccinia graminis f. sp. tritici]|uniref:Uncharacterized protein n=1 Tax=Puccinia graminis f. sp. tritici TaxID=56615 RepID=A0A5B0NVV7_PUCGR|nr:hypothetical protein PGT21_009994 [Puccinia graminis f. sp. tritici]KAA1093755.1 hypothetical protein PGTUg99_026734 [Puccinia graminis f. sp. tritici]